MLISVQEWDERRKKAIIRDYYKDLNKSGVERPLDTSINDDTIPIRQLKR
jgi:hypothetical protein